MVCVTTFVSSDTVNSQVNMGIVITHVIIVTYGMQLGEKCVNA